MSDNMVLLTLRQHALAMELQLAISELHVVQAREEYHECRRARAAVRQELAQYREAVDVLERVKRADRNVKNYRRDRDAKLESVK